MAATVSILVDILKNTESEVKRCLSDKVNKKFAAVETKDDFCEAMSTMFSEMVPQIQEVSPNLFIGNFKGIMDKDLIKSLGITHILNLAGGDIDFTAPLLVRPEHQGVHYQEMLISDFADIDDDGTQVRRLKEAAKSVDQFFTENVSAKVVVNCFAGLSRSASGVITYLMLHKNMSAMDALRTVKHSRDIFPNNSNLAHLARIHNEKFGFQVNNVFDIEKTNRDLEREKFNSSGIFTSARRH